MNLEDANKLIIDNKHLIGSIFNGDVIEKMLIVPKNGNNLDSIIKYSQMDIDYQNLLLNNDEFTVIVIFNESDSLFEGYTKYSLLSKII